jgi:hypothetical protein
MRLAERALAFLVFSTTPLSFKGHRRNTGPARATVDGQSVDTSTAPLHWSQSHGRFDLKCAGAVEVTTDRLTPEMPCTAPEAVLP